MSEDDDFRPRPPSSFHKSARGRPPTHDQMQAEVLAFLRTRSLAGIPEGVPIYREVVGEWPIQRRGQIVSFVDAVELVTIHFDLHVYAFEIKPAIDTVFGIVRQLKAMEALIAEQIRPKHCAVFAVVHCADPKLRELRAEWPRTWAWGIQFAEAER